MWYGATLSLHDCMIAWLHNNFHFREWPFDKQGHYSAVWSDRRSGESGESIRTGRAACWKKKRTKKDERETVHVVRRWDSHKCVWFWPQWFSCFDLLMVLSFDLRFYVCVLLLRPWVVLYFASKSTDCFHFFYKSEVQLQPHQFRVVLGSSLSGGFGFNDNALFGQVLPFEFWESKFEILK